MATTHSISGLRVGGKLTAYVPGTGYVATLPVKTQK